MRSYSRPGPIGKREKPQRLNLYPYGLPGGRTRLHYSDFKVPLSEYFPEGFYAHGTSSTAEAQSLWKNYQELCFTEVISAVNDSIRVLHVWQSRLPGIVQAWEAHVLGGAKWASVQEEFAGITRLDVRDFGLVWEVCPYHWLGGPVGRAMCEALGVVSESPYRLIFDVVEGRRRLGIDEPDIREILLPGIREEKKMRAHRTHTSLDDIPAVEITGYEEVVEELVDLSDGVEASGFAALRPEVV